MTPTENELRRKIVEIGRLAFDKGWVAANDGNISVRLDDERILATPTGVSKGMMSPEDLIIVDYQGNKILGRLQGTSEIAMHIAIYKDRPDIAGCRTGCSTDSRTRCTLLSPRPCGTFSSATFGNSHLVLTA